MRQRPRASSLPPRLFSAGLRLVALLVLLFATAPTQELLLLAGGAECCEDDACGGSGDCAPASCQVCSCCHFSAVPTAAPPLARLAVDSIPAPELEAHQLVSRDYRAPPFRPPAG